MQIRPYINFDGHTGDALKFYKKALGAKVGMVMLFKDLPPGTPTMGPIPPPDKIMHASFHAGETELFATDGQCGGNADFKGITLSLGVKTNAEAEKRFKALADGGKITMPMAATFFAARFGMVVDKFGVTWMVIRELPLAT